MATESDRKQLRTTVLKLLSLAGAMFVFAMWVMPPLYDLFCEVTGLNGKTKGQYTAVEAKVDTSRTVKVQFVSTNNEGMPWGFSPQDFSIQVHPGEAVVTNFIAHNPTEKIMVAQAIPSLIPHNATDYFHKTECFCFNQQTLAPGETAELGLQFIVDQELPKAVNTITLSYTLFDVTESAKEAVEQKQKELVQKRISTEQPATADSQTLTAR
ncbi:cytochrome c oxidase assembly protein [Teredinibacter waterburyi]|jgi:Cytochrome oxidase assembly factor|uniref:cytochrome c oxidase assembly protein n=1 Tax=Teredinibacter waterburyi TaxID=1500538 RepID=UPI00165F3390|nr:cytochrome c oxidase assembly protein [Teredinibacter waterburyi]